ncbi:MAG: hypothetical protein ABIM44_07370 [candidate division WOR-3 bacterium]
MLNKNYHVKLPQLYIQAENWFLLSLYLKNNLKVLSKLIRKTFTKHVFWKDKVNGKNIGELTLAALKIASLRLYYKIDGERLNAILNELDIEKYRFYLGVLEDEA